MRSVVRVYALGVVGVTVWMLVNSPASAPPATKGTSMNWSEVKDNIVVQAKPSGLWTWAFDFVRGPALILIEAKDGKWSYSPGKECGPDGDFGSLLNKDAAILPGAPVGSLIVKIGGSTAAANDGTVRVAGSKALLSIDEKVSGPIFLTINDELSGLSDNAGQMTVKISVAPVSTPAPAPKPSAVAASDVKP